MTAITNRLTLSYLNRQVSRVVDSVQQIRGRDSVSTGRVIPEASDLAIHDGRRLLASVMFLDISGFSARPSSTPAEQENLLRALSLFFTEMIRIVQDYGGVVEKNTGDGLMAYFVRETEDSVPPQQKAVAASLTMFYAATNLINPILSRSGLDPFSFRICIDHGPITIARVGAARGFNGIVAIGATANIASKMLNMADANTILVGTMVLEGLPADWRDRFVRLKSADTGWIFTSNGTPYAFWTYEGRWRDPVQ